MGLEEIQSSSTADVQEIQNPDSKIEEKDFSENDLKAEENVESKEKKEVKHTQENHIDKDLYEEVLEKLDIKPREKNQDIQEKTTQEKLKKEEILNKLKNLEKSKTENQIKTVIQNDFSKIQELVKAGLINSAQGQNLKKQVLKKAFDKLVQTEKIKRNILALPPKSNNNAMMADKNQIFEEFGKNNPEFLNSDGRKEVLNYLKSGNVFVGRDELDKISEIVRMVEKTAIERYLEKTAYEKKLRESNKAAKEKLTANAQNSKGSKNLSRTFTREQIGKMSSIEFAKYESQIMTQLKKGQIK